MNAKTLIVAVVAAGAGFAGGFFFAKKNLTSQEFKDEQAAEEKKQDALDEALSGEAEPAKAEAPAGWKGGAVPFSVQSHGMSRVSFTSDAPLETIVGTTSKVTGDFTVDLADVTKSSVPAINVDIATIRTGVDLRDEHLRGDGWFDAANYPNAIFVLESVEAADGRLWPGRTVDVALKGKLKIKDIEKPVEATASVGYHKHTEELSRFGIDTDVLRIKANFEVKLSDYGMSPPVVGTKVAEVVQIALNLTATQGD